MRAKLILTIVIFSSGILWQVPAAEFDREAYNEYFFREVYFPAMKSGKCDGIGKEFEKLVKLKKSIKEKPEKFNFGDYCKSNKKSHGCTVYTVSSKSSEELDKLTKEMLKYKDSPALKKETTFDYRLHRLFLVQHFFSPGINFKTSDWMKFLSNNAYDRFSWSNGRATSQEEFEAENNCLPYIEALSIAKYSDMLYAKAQTVTEAMAAAIDAWLDDMDPDPDFKNKKGFISDFESECNATHSELLDVAKAHSLETVKYCADKAHISVSEVQKKLCQINADIQCGIIKSLKRDLASQKSKE